MVINTITEIRNEKVSDGMFAVENIFDSSVILINAQQGNFPDG